MGNHPFSATDLMSLLLALCCALFFSTRPPPVLLYFCVLFSSTTPLSLKVRISHSPLFEVISCLFTLGFLSQTTLHSLPCLIMASAGPQVKSCSMDTFLPRVHNGPFGFAMAVRAPPSLSATLSAGHLH